MIFLLDWVNCVRWNPSGQSLATASDDTELKIIDFAAEKIVGSYITSSDSISKTLLFYWYHSNLFSHRVCYFSLLYLIIKAERANIHILLLLNQKEFSIPVKTILDINR